MRIGSLISHFVVAGVGAIGSYVVLTGHLGIIPSLAQTPAASAGQRSTELFNRAMDDVLGRRLTVRLTEPRQWQRSTPASWKPHGRLHSGRDLRGEN